MNEIRRAQLRDAEDTISLPRLRALDPVAFNAAFTVFAPRLNGYLLRMGLSQSVAEELVQEAFLRLARHAPQLREDTRIGAWLFTTTRNLYVSHRRWSWLDGTRLLELAEAALRPQPSTPAELVAASEAAARVERAIAGLPESQRAVFLLVTSEGVEPHEAAEILGITPETARQRLARARRAIEEVCP